MVLMAGTQPTEASEVAKERFAHGLCCSDTSEHVTCSRKPSQAVLRQSSLNFQNMLGG